MHTYTVPAYLPAVCVCWEMVRGYDTRSMNQNRQFHLAFFLSLAWDHTHTDLYEWSRNSQNCSAVGALVVAVVVVVACSTLIAYCTVQYVELFLPRYV